MRARILLSSAVAAALVAIPAERATADAGDFLAGAIIGGVIGANAKKKKRTVKRSYSSKKTYRSKIPATQEGRLIQTSLNYFGFNAGSVDGQLGRKSKEAISQYQAHMGFPITGKLAPFEQQFLFDSYQRAQAGGFATSQLVAQQPDGPRGLLRVYRNELAGQTQPSFNQPAPTTTVVVNPAPAPVPAAPESVLAGAIGIPALPNFLGESQQASLASHCNKISLLTNSNGGFTTQASMTDASFALNEQFCLARTFAITYGEDLAAKVQGASQDQIVAQCEAFGPALKEQVAALSLKPRDEVITDVRNFILASGMTPEQLTHASKICLSVGYRTDNMDVAMGSALMLTAMGTEVYAELLGHHLSQGFGATERLDLASAWYDMSLTALEGGATPAILPGMPERTGLLRRASMMINGEELPADPQGINVPANPVLPVFILE